MVLNRGSSENFDSDSSSSGLSSESSSKDSIGSSSSNSSSGLSSCCTESTDNKSRTKESMTPHQVSSKVPLTRGFIWILLTSAIGFLLGQNFGSHPGAKQMLQEALPVTWKATMDRSLPKESMLAPNQTVTPQSLLLQQYLEEWEQKTIRLPQFTSQKASEEKEAAEARLKRKEFAEFVVHPTLLVSGFKDYPDDPPESVAVAVNVDDLGLAHDLLQEIQLHKHIEVVTIYMVGTNRKSLPDSWGCTENILTVLDLGQDELACLYIDADSGCPMDLMPLKFSSSFELTCEYIDTSWGHEKEDYISDHIIEEEWFDVAIILSGCDAIDPIHRKWEEELNEFVESMAITCSGPKRKNGRPLLSLGAMELSRRQEMIDTFANPEIFQTVLDYEVQGMNLAVGFHKDVEGGEWKWHFQEPQYKIELYSRVQHQNLGIDALEYFDAPDMIKLQYPSRHSFDSYCDWIEDDEENLDIHDFCEVGFDPDLIDISIDDIYVNKSTIGENAGRGVFTGVDILEDEAYIGLENSPHSVLYPPMSQWIVYEMMDIASYNDYSDNVDLREELDTDEFVLDGTSLLMRDNMHRAVSVYGEAYGYLDEPWGMLQTTVMSSILTFTNHGCNGTANIAYNVPGFNEFTADPSSESFQIPDAFKRSSGDPYRPHQARSYERTLGLSQAFHPPIFQGQELFDNYIGFGGETGFVPYLEELKRDCSGALGTVELQQQRTKKRSHHNIHSQRRRPSSEAPSRVKSRAGPNTAQDDDDDDDDDDDHIGSEEL